MKEHITCILNTCISNGHWKLITILLFILYMLVYMWYSCLTLVRLGSLLPSSILYKQPSCNTHLHLNIIQFSLLTVLFFFHFSFLPTILTWVSCQDGGYSNHLQPPAVASSRRPPPLATQHWPSSLTFPVDYQKKKSIFFMCFFIPAFVFQP